MVREKRNSYLEFIVSNQNFTINSDTSDFINKTSFENSPENDKLYEYFQLANKLGKEAEKLQSDKKIAEEKGNDKKTKDITEQLTEISVQMKDYKENFLNLYPDNAMSVVFKLQKEVDFPSSLLNDTSANSERNKYNYFIQHYWDQTPFESTCILRTPVFHFKLQQFFDKYIPQHYDSAIVYIDDLITKTKANEELYKYVVNYVSFKWESGKEKRMCWDKVFYHMATNYYMKGDCPWTDSTQLAKIESRAKDLKYVLCGDQAVNLHMKKYYPQPGLYDTSSVMHDLYKVNADIIIMWFWDSDCGHCKKQTPILWETYNKYKGLGKSIEVYAINVEQESAGYKKYLKENNYTWINVQDTGNFSQFRRYYDIYSTPVAYILDKNRKLIGKRLDPKGIENFLDQYYKEEEEISSGK